MYINRLVNSVTIIPEIDELSDNVNRLYNIGGTLYFNGQTIGSGTGTGTGDADNVQANLTSAISDLNANDYNTYTSLQSELAANDYNTLLSAQSNDYSTYTTLQSELAANDYNTYTSLQADINSVQDNVTVASGGFEANDYNTYTTLQNELAANDYNTYTSLHSDINTVQANLTSIISAAPSTLDTLGEIAAALENDANIAVTLTTAIGDVQSNLSALPDSAANDYSTYTTLQGELAANDYNTLLSAQSNDYNTYTSLQSELAANDYNTYTTLYSNIDTVQANLTALPDSAANDYSTYTTLQASINSVQSNLDLGGGAWSSSGDNIYYSSGRVSISPTVQDPASNLYVTGNTYVSGNVEVGDTLIEHSSIRVKQNITALEDQLAKILLLRPVEYDKIISGSHEYGLISEEVAKIAPSVVGLNNSAVQYTRIVPMLIQAVQELYLEVEHLKGRLNG